MSDSHDPRPKDINSLRSLARSGEKTRATTTAQRLRESAMKASGKDPHFSFGRNLSDKQLVWMKDAFPEHYSKFTEMVRLMIVQGVRPLFVNLAGAAGSGIPGTQTISVTLSPGEKPLDESHKVLSGDLATTSMRNELISKVEASGPLVFVDFNPLVPALDYENDPYAKAKFHALIRALYERLVPGGLILLVLRQRPELENELRTLFADSDAIRVQGKGNMLFLFKKNDALTLLPGAMNTEKIVGMESTGLNDRGKVEQGELRQLEGLLTDFYVGEYFEAVFRQIEHRVDVGEARNSFGLKMLMFNVRERNKITKSELMHLFKTSLLDVIASEVEKTSEDWSGAFVKVPPKPDVHKRDIDISVVLEYLHEAGEAFMEYEREVGTAERLGGKKWANIAHLASELWKEGKGVTYENVVRAVGLEHNTGTIYGRKVQKILDIRHQPLPLHEMIDQLGDAVQEKDVIAKWRRNYHELLKFIENAPGPWRAAVLPMVKGAFSIEHAPRDQTWSQKEP